MTARAPRGGWRRHPYLPLTRHRRKQWRALVEAGVAAGRVNSGNVNVLTDIVLLRHELYERVRRGESLSDLRAVVSRVRTLEREISLDEWADGAQGAKSVTDRFLG